MTCKDCVHYEVCDYTSILDEFVEENCKSFKNKEKIISALEKQIPKKPINRKGTTYFHCPVCDGNMLNNYCADCGQAILWESE